MNSIEQAIKNSKTTLFGLQHPNLQANRGLYPKKETNPQKKQSKGKQCNLQDDTESRTEFFQRLNWTDTLLTEAEKQRNEDFLVDYHDIFARRKMDIGKKTEFRVNLTPRDDKAVYCQSLPMPIHLEDNLIVEFALMHNYGTSQ